MDLDALLVELGRRLGVESLGLDEHGVCRLVFDKKLVVDLEPTDDRKHLHVTAVVGVVPPDAGPQFFRKLLAASFVGQETGGAAFAVDELNGEIVLWQRVALDALDIVGFTQDLDEFVNRLDLWIGRLESADAADAANGPRTEGLIPPGVGIRA